MGGRGDDTEDDHALRDHRVDDHRAEDLVILAQVLGHLRGLGHAAEDVDRRHAGLGLADVEAFLLEAVLDGVGDLPAFRAERVALRGIDDLHALHVADHERHRQRLGVHLAAHVGAQIVDDLVRAGDEAADRGHRLGEGADVEVDVVHAAQLLGGAAAVRAQQAEAVGVVDHDTEFVFLLQRGDLIQDAERAGHAEHALGDQQHAAAVLLRHLAGAGEDFLAVGDVVVTIFVLFADVQADAVQQAGVALGVIDDDVVARGQRVDRGHDALVAEVVEERVLLLLEFGEGLLELLVIAGMAAHHAGAHRVRQAPLRRRVGVRLADSRVVGQAQVVVQAPVEHRGAVEDHVGAEFALQTGIHIVAEALLEILSDRAAAVAFDSVKNV